MNHFGSAEPFDAPQQKQHIAVNSSIATLLFAFKLYTFCLKKLQKKVFCPRSNHQFFAG